MPAHQFELSELCNPAYFRWENQGFRQKLGRAQSLNYDELTPTVHSDTWHVQLYEKKNCQGPLSGQCFVKELFVPPEQNRLYTALRNPALLLAKQVANVKKISAFNQRQSPQLYGFSQTANSRDCYVFATNWVSGNSMRQRLIEARSNHERKLECLYDAVQIIAEFDGQLEKNRKELNGEAFGKGSDIAEIVDSLTHILKFAHQDEDWVHDPNVSDRIRKLYSLDDGLEGEVARIISLEPAVFVDGFQHKRHRDVRSHHIIGQKIVDYEEVGDDKYWQDVASFFTAEGRIALPDFKELPRLAAWYIIHEEASRSGDEASEPSEEMLSPEEAEKSVETKHIYQGALEILGILLGQELHIDAHNKRYDRQRRWKLKEGIPNWTEQQMLEARRANIHNIIDYVSESSWCEEVTNPTETKQYFGAWGHLLKRLELVQIDDSVIRRLHQ